MEIDFQYGKTGRKISIPDECNIDIIQPEKTEALVDPVEEIYASLSKPMSSQPLKKLLQKKKPGPIIIVIDDHTRPIQSKHILIALSRVFEELHIEDQDVKILVGTGLHRAPTPEELERMVGKEIIYKYDILFHDANDTMNLEHVGGTKHGNQVYLNADYVNAAFKIITGYVEPHFFAGYSGGRKAIVPGIAGKDTILHNHSPKNIDSNAHFGILDENPIHLDAEEATRLSKAKPDFSVIATINSNHQITSVKSGNIFSVHNYLVQQQQKTSFKEIEHKYDVVICGNGGYPLDLNLYQAVKSMSIGELAGKENAAVISVNECSDGVGQDSFNELINSEKTPKEIYADAVAGKINVPDVWEIQILARVLMNYQVYVVSSMKNKELGTIGLRHALTVNDAILDYSERYNLNKDELKVLVLPKGPLILPKLKTE